VKPIYGDARQFYSPEILKLLPRPI
jgi:hypothetical protein